MAKRQLTDAEMHANALAYVPLAKRIASLVGLPVRAIMAARILEAGYEIKLTGDFNPWGITWIRRIHGPDKRKWCATHEDLSQKQIDAWPLADEKATMRKVKRLENGKWKVAMYRWFASYANEDEAVADYVRVLNLGNYDGARAAVAKDPNDMLGIGRGLKAGGYGSGETYAESFAAIANGSRLRRVLEDPRAQ